MFDDLNESVLEWVQRDEATRLDTFKQAVIDHLTEISLTGMLPQPLQPEDILLINERNQRSLEDDNSLSEFL